MGKKNLKNERHKLLAQKIEQDPFLKDEELAEAFDVSVATIRFDRAELGIAGYRERIREVAKRKMEEKGHPGEVLDLNLFHDGISMMKTTRSMTFGGTDIVKGQEIFAFAENLAVSVIGARAALIKVANMKYCHEVHPGEKLVAKSEVIRVQDKEYIVWVIIKSKMAEVFRGKFMLIVPKGIESKSSGGKL